MGAKKRISASTSSCEATVTLPGLVTPAPPGLHGFDTNGVLGAASCRAAKARGFSFCLRYVSRGERQSASDLSEAEARTILNAGLALMPVQHVAHDGWAPSKALGTVYGRNAAGHALSIGFPPGINVWLDLEGVKPSTSHRIVIDYCNAWFAEVASAGFSSRHLYRGKGGSYGRGDLLASSDYAFLEVWKQGPGYASPGLSNGSKNHQGRQNRKHRN